MYNATADTVMPTSIIGSLPRPSWFTENLNNRSFLEAMVDIQYREQYEDAVTVYLNAQRLAGLDILTDGDAHYDQQVAGFSWQSYAPYRMSGFSTGRPQPNKYAVGAAAYPRGHILHDFLEARILPRIVDEVGPGDLQYAEMWMAGQRLTDRPVCSPRRSKTIITRIRSTGPGR